MAFYFTTGWDWAHTGIVSIVRDVSLLYTEGSPQTTLEKWRYNWTQGEASYTVPVHFQFFHCPIRKWFRRSSIIRTGGVLLGWKILCQAGVRTTEKLLESWPSHLKSIVSHESIDWRMNWLYFCQGSRSLWPHDTGLYYNPISKSMDLSQPWL